MDAYRVIRHPCDEDEGARWTCRARQQLGPVEIASGPALAVLRLGRTWLSASIGGGIFLFIPWLVRLVGLSNGRVAADESPGERITEESYVTSIRPVIQPMKVIQKISLSIKAKYFSDLANLGKTV